MSSVAMGRTQHRCLTLTFAIIIIATCYNYGSDYIDLEMFRADSKGLVNLGANDVIVSLPVVRTGMTSLAQYLVREVKGELACQCRVKVTRCSCRNRAANIWLFNAYNSTGHPAGQSADLATMTSFQLDHWFRTSGGDTREYRRYFLVTLLRDPIARYVSEWLHLRRRNWTFINEPRLWRPESPELQKKGLSCLVGKMMATLSLTDFINCKDNPANNRQTRTLADASRLSVMTSPPGSPANNAALLRSAIEFIQSVPYFGLLSALDDSTALLERQFNLPLRSRMKTHQTDSDRVLLALSPRVIRQISNLNRLDVQLYRLAIKLFVLRFRSVMGYNASMLPSPPDPEEDLGYFYSDDGDREAEIGGGMKVSDFLTEAEMRREEEGDEDVVGGGGDDDEGDEVEMIEDKDDDEDDIEYDNNDVDKNYKKTGGEEYKDGMKKDNPSRVEDDDEDQIDDDDKGKYKEQKSEDDRIEDDNIDRRIERSVSRPELYNKEDDVSIEGEDDDEANDRPPVSKVKVALDYSQDTEDVALFLGRLQKFKTNEKVRRAKTGDKHDKVQVKFNSKDQEDNENNEKKSKGSMYMFLPKPKTQKERIARITANQNVMQLMRGNQSPLERLQISQRTKLKTDSTQHKGAKVIQTHTKKSSTNLNGEFVKQLNAQRKANKRKSSI